MFGPRTILKKALAGLLITTFLIGVGLYRLDKLNSIPIDPINFSWINKAEIYALGIVMSAIAYPIYPEVAREHMMMYTPFDTAPKVIIDCPSSCNWNTQRPNLREDLAHLVDNIKRRVCGIASAGSPWFSV